MVYRFPTPILNNWNGLYFVGWIIFNRYMATELFDSHFSLDTECGYNLHVYKALSCGTHM